MASKKDKDFELNNLPIEAQDPEIKKEDFVIVSNNKTSHEQKFQTKPTTFLNDSLHRFAKNKSSVVAAIILGVLLLLSIIIPIADTSVTYEAQPSITYLQPKLFDAGTGFWDGTKRWDNIPVDVSNDPEGKDKERNWFPNPKSFEPRAVTNKTFTDLVYTSSASEFGKEGYIQLGYYETIEDSEEYVEFKTRALSIALSTNVNHYISTFDTYDSKKLAAIETESALPENYVLGESALYFEYLDSDNKEQEIELIGYSSTHNINSKVSSVKTDKVNISSIIHEEMVKQGSSQVLFKSPCFAVRVKNNKQKKNTCVLVRSIEFETESENADFISEFVAPSFADATECYLRTVEIKNKPNPAYWTFTGKVNKIFMSKVHYCSFTYDIYEAKLGLKVDNAFPVVNIEQYSKGKNRTMRWNCDRRYNKETDEWYVVKETFECEILNPEKCPVAEKIEYTDVYLDSDGAITGVKATVYQYRVLGYDSMPRFIFGTDKQGKDMLKLVFEGLRTSLLLGIITTVVCFLFGLAYGAISGYFGGTVDLVMERFTDILSGIPWIVVMTLVILHMPEDLRILAFAIALCLTGWIGTAATTRTQFYRFRGREYVLASRTLGASDARLIAKHILPNAMGTIITSAVLMVPSVIFSEATISYLGLGLRNMASLGVILSDNQIELSTNPFLLVFPSVIIALVMISFNLAGNGLRDAVNPSLKGEDE